MKHYLINSIILTFNMKIFVLILAFLVMAICQQFVTPVSLQDDKPTIVETFFISNNLADLPITEQIHQNTFIEKSIQLSTQQTLSYSSSVLSPIFVLEKNYCHAHQGTVQINKLQDIYYHDSFINNVNDPLAGNSFRPKDVSSELPFSDPLSLSQEHSWVSNKKYNILYKISSSLTVDAYKIKHQSIAKKLQSVKNSKQTTISLNQQQQTQVQKAIINIATVELLQTIQQRYSFFNECSQEANVLPILSKNSQKLYIFVCNAIYMIECQAVLAKREILMYFGTPQKNGKKQLGRPFMGIEVKTVNQYIFWLSQSQGIRIYGITLDGRLQFVQTVKVPSIPSQNTNNSKPKTQSKQAVKLSSLEYINGMLYVLTLNHGIFVYQRLSAYHFQLESYLQYLPELSKLNKEILIEEDRMLIWTESKKWQFIAEINIKSKTSINNQQSSSSSSSQIIKKKSSSTHSLSYSLNRYFKGYRSISQIQILNQQSKPTDQSKSSSATQKQLLLLIASQKGIELYPLNKDPREISMMMNGVINSHIGKDIREVYEIGNGVFVFESFRETFVDDEDQENEESGTKQTKAQDENQDSLELQSSVVETYLVLMSPKYPSISCNFQQEGVYTVFVEQQIPVKQKSPLSPNNKQISTSPHNRHNHNHNHSQIQLQPPTPISLHYQPHFYHKLIIKVKNQISIQYITLLVSILSITFLIAIVSLLIYWRQNKLTLIDQLVKQIRRLHQSRLRSVQFEQSSPPKAIERRWDELREQIEGEISYKIDNTQDNPDFDNNLMSQRNFYKQSQNQRDEANIKIEPFSDPVKNQVSPLSQSHQRNNKSLQNGDRSGGHQSKQIKTLKNDMEISHEQIVIETPSQKQKDNSENKDQEQFEDKQQQVEQFQQLKFGTRLSEQLVQKQVNLSILDEDYEEKDKDRLLEKGPDEGVKQGDQR